MSIVAMGLWASALDNMSRSGGSSDFSLFEMQEKLKAENEKRAEKMYKPGVFSRMLGTQKIKPGDIFEKKTGNLSEDEKWLLEYELNGIKVWPSGGSPRKVQKYNTLQVSDIVNLYDKDPETAAKIKPYLAAEIMSPAKLLQIYKNDPKLFAIMQSKGIINGDFREVFSLASLGLKHLKPEYAQSKNPAVIKRFDEIAMESKDKAKLIDSIIADKGIISLIEVGKDIAYTPVNPPTDDNPKVIDKFVDFYAKDKDFIKRLLTCTNSESFWNKIECDIYDKKNKGKWLEYLVNVLEEFDKLEKKGIDKNALLDGEMKPFTETIRNSKVENVDTLEYLRAKNKELEQK